MRPMGNPLLVNPQGTESPQRPRMLPMAVLRRYWTFLRLYSGTSVANCAVGNGGIMVGGTRIASPSRGVRRGEPRGGGPRGGASREDGPGGPPPPPPPPPGPG